MNTTFKALLAQLKTVCNRYDSESESIKNKLLDELSKKKLITSSNFEDYQNTLLFIIAHPSNELILNKAEKELTRLSNVIKKANKTTLDKLKNTGLPYTQTLSTFTHDLLKWYSTDANITLKIDSLYKSSICLSDALQFTLPILEKEITSIGYKNKALFETLKIKKENQFQFLLSEFDKLEEQPFIKDYLFNGLHLYMKMLPKNQLFSKAYNRIKPKNYFYHSEVIKQFDQVELLNKKLPPEKKFSNSELKNTLSVIKNSLTLLQRETDPVTYLDEKSFRLYELERGISIAIYGITASRQLPLESYVGYTLLKNGLPAAYGGAWVFGKRSLFGINIFEPYRGGESGYMMCQLLRVYRQAFGVDYFEVEPYQYGLDNPEGISSGAYWFYFRFGFRSLDTELNKLSLNEFEKIKSQKGYRSSEETLLRFTESNIALNMGKGIPLTIAEVREKATQLIAEKYQGNRLMAEQEIIKNFIKKAGVKKTYSKEQKKMLSEIAFFAEAMKINAPAKLKLMHEMVLSKSIDLYAYQALLKKVLS